MREESYNLSILQKDQLTKLCFLLERSVHVMLSFKCVYLSNESVHASIHEQCSLKIACALTHSTTGSPMSVTIIILLMYIFRVLHTILEELISRLEV